MRLYDFLHGNDKKVLSRIAELVTVNRGELAPKHRGVPVATTENRYGRWNLTIDEAMELMYLRGKVEAFIEAFEDNADIAMFQDVVKRESEGVSIQVVTMEQLNSMLRSR